MRKVLSNSYILAFLAGFFSLSLEILGTEVTFSFFARTSEAMASALSAFLLGLGAGSWLAKKYNASLIFHLPRVMTFVFFAIAFFSGPLLSNFDSLQILLLDNNHTSIGLRSIFIFLCFLNLFLPAVLIGIIFPLANDVMSKRVSTGAVNLSDLLGAVVGALLAGFV